MTVSGWPPWCRWRWPRRRCAITSTTATAWSVRVGVRPAARRVAERWVRQGTDTGHTLGFDTGVLVAAMDRQAELEAAAGPGSSLLAVTEPTETAVAAAFAHTAVLAGRPDNEAPLREIGQLFGRVAHLLDAVEDYRDDVARGKWNPLAATETPVAEVRALCDDAVLGIELALADVEFTDGRLATKLLTREVRRAVSRTFSAAGHSARNGTPHGAAGSHQLRQPARRGGFRTGQDGGEELGPDGVPGRRRRAAARRRRGCFCCCDGCDCCCEADCCCDAGCCDCS